MQSLNRLKSERPRRAYDFYETPIELAREALQRFENDEGKQYLCNVLDAGAGNGVWGMVKIASFVSWLTGVDIRNIKPNEEYDFWIESDYLNFYWYPTPSVCSSKYDFIMGNPPYSLAEEFVRHSFEIVEDSGYIFFLFRLAFLESQKRIPLYRDYPPKRVYVLQRRPSFFSANGKTRTTDATSYAMFLWQKGWEGKTELDWLYWEYD